MKTIGIRQADGSFYSILEEENPGKKTLGLTTAKDNQTRVIVDLYRSHTGTMEDAEYVDSLQIDNLIAHAKGSSEIKLNIGLDEDGKLSAELIDPETGLTSSADVTLVNRTLEERLADTSSEVSVSDEKVDLSDLDDLSLPESDSSAESEVTKTEDNSDDSGAAFAAGAAAGAVAGGLLAAAMKSEKSSENNDAADSLDTTEDSASGSLDSFDLPDFEQESSAAEGSDDTVVSAGEDAESDSAVSATDDLDIPDFSDLDSSTELNVTKAADSSENSSGDSLDSFDLPDFEESSDTAGVTESAEPTSAAGDSLDSFDFPDFEESSDTASVTESAEPTAAAGDSLDSFDLPDFEESSDTADSTESIETPKVEDNNFDFPDFGTDPADTAASTDLNSDDLFSDNSFLDNFDDAENSDPSEPAPDSTLEMMKHSNALKFDNLYDKETMEGDSSVESEEEEVVKKTKVPVIICIICAIICVIATLLILFVVPSKYNLLNKKSVEPDPVTVIAEEPETIPEPEPEIIESKEEEVIVVDEPEKVVPEPPKEPEEKPVDITYKIKWGDTLWDIADAYYKNPWNYKKIARYNGIRNPDYIISGTYIKIPAK